MFPFRAALVRIVVPMFPIAPALAAAQSTPNVISGIVKDSSGGVLPGVTVKITSDATNTSTDIITNADGTYASGTLEPGQYRVAVTLDGFETVERRVVVAAGQPLVNDVTLAPARFSASPWS